jgi:hypothetical protein
MHITSARVTAWRIALLGFVLVCCSLPLTAMDYRMARQSLASTLYLKWAEALVQKDAKRAEQLFAEAQRFHPDPAIVLEELATIQGRIRS